MKHFVLSKCPEVVLKYHKALRLRDVFTSQKNNAQIFRKKVKIIIITKSQSLCKPCKMKWTLFLISVKVLFTPCLRGFSVIRFLYSLTGLFTSTAREHARAGAYHCSFQASCMNVTVMGTKFLRLLRIDKTMEGTQMLLHHMYSYIFL